MPRTEWGVTENADFFDSIRQLCPAKGDIFVVGGGFGFSSVGSDIVGRCRAWRCCQLVSLEKGTVFPLLSPGGTRIGSDERRPASVIDAGGRINFRWGRSG